MQMGEPRGQQPTHAVGQQRVLRGTAREQVAVQPQDEQVLERAATGVRAVHDLDAGAVAAQRHAQRQALAQQRR